MASAGDNGDLGWRLLAPDEPAPVLVLNPSGCSSFLLIADHAGTRVPRRLNDLGLAPADRNRHIAVDIGIAELAAALSERLNTAAVTQVYSRLVIDCNRSPQRPDAVPDVSDGSPVPGNRGLSPVERQARVDEVHAPYHAAIAAELARAARVGAAPVVVALHSFTPALSVAANAGAARPWRAGVLYGGGDERYARKVLAGLRQRLEPPVGDNEPYAMDGIDYTIPHHCFAAGRPYVELEIRQDMLASRDGVEHWSALLATVLEEARLAIA